LEKGPTAHFPFSLIFSPKRPFGLVATRLARPKPVSSGPPASSSTSGSRHSSAAARPTAPRAAVRLRPPPPHETGCLSASSSFPLPQSVPPPLRLPSVPSRHLESAPPPPSLPGRPPPRLPDPIKGRNTPAATSTTRSHLHPLLSSLERSRPSSSDHRRHPSSLCRLLIARRC
jgi:hypothetical protein